MLGRYKMYRGKRPTSDPLPDGIRQDTRKHTRHCLRPTEEIVWRYLKDPSQQEWLAFKREYLSLLENRFAADRIPFDKLAALAKSNNVYLGCNCPTKTNLNVRHCHTVLALNFMQVKYPDIRIEFPLSATKV